MIKYTLKCPDSHEFESWFKSAAAFDQLANSNLVICPACGSTEVTKAIMAPKVRTARAAATKPTGTGDAPAAMHALTAPASEAEKALTELKKKIEDNSEYVGKGFAAEARAIHDGDAPERSIYGEANSEEARALVKDGVPVAPLPFTPTRKTN